MVILQTILSEIKNKSKPYLIIITELQKKPMYHSISFTINQTREGIYIRCSTVRCFYISENSFFKLAYFVSFECLLIHRICTQSVNVRRVKIRCTAAAYIQNCSLVLKSIYVLNFSMQEYLFLFYFYNF